MKNIMPALIGNRALAKKLGADVLSGSISHAYIIGGPEGSGKHTLARLLAASISCENKSSSAHPLPCSVCENCRKIFSGISPDIITAGLLDRATIGVDSIRDIKLGTLSAPNDLDVKFYIIENADKMTDQAQNALLLTLEEPPPYLMFLLLCERPEDLLETIRSRAPIIRTEPVTPEEMDLALAELPEIQELRRENEAGYREILMAADGNIGKALRFCERDSREEILDSREHVRRFIRALQKRASGEELVDIMNDFPTGRTELCERLSLAELALRDLVLLKRSEYAPLCFYSDREEALTVSDGFSISALLGHISSCEKARIAVSRNANIKLTIMNLVNRSIHGK